VQITEHHFAEISHLLRTTPEETAERVAKLQSDQRAGIKQIEQLKASLAAQKVSGGGETDIHVINGVKTIIQTISVDSPAALRDLADRLSDRLKSGIVVLGTEASGKAQLIVKITKDLTDRYHAGDIIKAAAAEVGGSGGGRPDMAQAGGSQPAELPAALQKASKMIETSG